MDKIEDFNAIGGNDNIKEPIKRNDINQPNKYYKKEKNKININRKCINKKKTSIQQKKKILKLIKIKILIKQVLKSINIRI